MHNNVDCPHSEVEYSYDKCSCSANRCPHGNIMYSFSAVGCSHDNICCFSTGRCSGDVVFVLQGNVPHGNLSS
jgi:hypothetical protein